VISTIIKYCEVFIVTVDEVWVGNWITEHLEIVTTNNYSAIANSYRLLAAAHTKTSQSVFASRFLATAPNNVLCLHLHWLANISQLTPRLAAISHEPSIILIA
jgi:hypothetical protein